MNGAELLDLVAGMSRSERRVETLPPRILRFSLVYSDPPDLGKERARVAQALGTDFFSLTAIETDPAQRLSRVLILQFTDLRRTLSARAQFEMAEEIARRLDLVACEPDIGAQVFLEPDLENQRVTSPESAIVGLWCNSDAPAPANRTWAVDAIRARQAWAATGARGAGIVVAQPDTGIAEHVELGADAIDLGRAGNVIEGGGPTDPLTPGMSNPGHGTATASVLASRESLVIAGAAPAAKVAPIRCADSVVIIDGTAVAAAVNHARAKGCDVVTMSLGGLRSAPLGAAIEDAVEAGLIVLAAAGNCVDFVTYPASHPQVIAVAAVDSSDRPWRGTCSGAKVDVSAPGENVFVARRRPGDPATNVIGPSQGTSFAVALTAGVAALWLSHFGRDAIRAEAARRGVAVNALFRSALRQTARRPATWDGSRHGAGIVDADRLLRLRLREIDLAPTPASIGGPGRRIDRIMALATTGGTIEGFDWTRHGAEASFLAAEAAIAARRSRIGFESVGRGRLVPSAEVARTASWVLRGLMDEERPERLAPSRRRAFLRAERLMRLAATTGTGLESASAVSTETARQRLEGGQRRVALDQMDAAVRRLPAAGPEIEAERQRTVAQADRALSKLARTGPAASLTAGEQFALEALVSLQNRPAIRVRDDAIDPADPMLGDWNGFLFNTAELTGALGAVGRINLDGVHVGTGWVLGPGLVATNRHVLEDIAEEFVVSGGPSRWVLRHLPTVNFHDAGVGTERSFALTDVVWAGSDRIDGEVDFGHLDMAVLAAETTNGQGAPLPKPIPLAQEGDLVARGTQVLLCGYPARPGASSLRDPQTGLVRDDVAARLRKLFGFSYSVKYLSPGEIQAAPGALDGDARAWVFGHDATTLGGSSGSWAIHLGDPFAIVGLHFGGGTLRANYAHALASVSGAQVLPAAALDGAVWI